MKRLILTFAAMFAVAGSLPATVAVAKDGRGSRWEQPGGGGGNRGQGAERGGGRWQEMGGPNRGGDSRGDRGGPRWERPRPSAEQPPRGAYGVRRGGVLPPQAEGRPIEDPAAHRLRTPPRGYNWVRVPGGYALVDGRTGQIFDMVPTR
jgi:Ni/Co efflux regulator RcnB